MDEVRVKVRLYATLRRFLPEAALGQATVFRLPPGASLGDLIDRLGIHRAETKSCFVNGRQQDQDYRLAEGDDLALFPPIGGGC